jgi:hypothetical protein
MNGEQNEMATTCCGCDCAASVRDGEYDYCATCHSETLRVRNSKGYQDMVARLSGEKTAEEVMAGHYAAARKALAGWSSALPVAKKNELVTVFARTTEESNCLIHPLFGAK